MSPLSFVLSIALISGLIGAVLGSSRQRSWAGFWLSFILGPLGWIIIFFIPKRRAEPALRQYSNPAAQPAPEFRRRWHTEPMPQPSGFDIGTLILGLIAVAILALCFLKKGSSAQPSPPTVPGSFASTPDGPTAITAPRPASFPAALQLSSEDLFLVRGYVTSVASEGLTIQCYNSPGYPIPPNASKADVARAANAAAMGIDPFGELMGVERGVLHPVDWELSRYASGVVRITNHPLQSECYPGKFIKVAAANLATTPGESTFTMAYTVADPPGTWMWQHSGRTTLEQPAKKVRRR